MMNAGLHGWPQRSLDTNGGWGPGPGNMEPRVSLLETAFAQIEKKIDRIELKLERHDEAFRRIEEALRSLADDNRVFSRSLAEGREKAAHIDGRLANIPTFWQMLALIATLLIGVAALLFTASRFLHP